MPMKDVHLSVLKKYKRFENRIRKKWSFKYFKVQNMEKDQMIQINEVTDSSEGVIYDVILRMNASLDSCVHLYLIPFRLDGLLGIVKYGEVSKLTEVT